MWRESNDGIEWLGWMDGWMMMTDDGLLKYGLPGFSLVTPLMRPLKHRMEIDLTEKRAMFDLSELPLLKSASTFDFFTHTLLKQYQ